MSGHETDEGAELVPISDDAPMVLDPRTVEVYDSMLATVPDAGGGGFDGILDAIAAATDPGDLDAPWRSAGLKAYANAKIKVTGIRKLPSDFEGGLSHFLIIDGVITSTGEVVAITSGAVSVVAQLVKAWQAGWFPINVVPRIAARASRNGFFPMHLEIVA